MHRVYLETFDPPLWGVDEGPDTKPDFVKKVIIEAHGSTELDTDADNKNNPKAWIQFQNAKLLVINDIAILREKWQLLSALIT